LERRLAWKSLLVVICDVAVSFWLLHEGNTRGNSRLRRGLIVGRDAQTIPTLISRLDHIVLAIPSGFVSLCYMYSYETQQL